MFWTQETYRIHDLVPGELTPGSAEHVARSLACYDAPDRPRIMEAFRRCAEEGNAYDIELPFTSAKGRRMWVRTIAEAVLDRGRVARVVGNIMDITERKRLEEILQARLRLSEAAATLSLERSAAASAGRDRAPNRQLHRVHSFRGGRSAHPVPADVVHEHPGEDVHGGG